MADLFRVNPAAKYVLLDNKHALPEEIRTYITSLKLALSEFRNFMASFSYNYFSIRNVGGPHLIRDKNGKSKFP